MEESKQLYTLGFWSVKRGKEGEFITAWESFARWTMQNQSGTVGDAQLLQDIADQQRFISFGAWEGMERVQEWRQRPEFKEFFIKAKELCEDIQPRTLKVVASTVR